MIHLYNKNKKKIAGLIDYKNLSIEKILESGDKTLSFSYPKTSNYYFNIEEECYIRTKEDEFVVKEKNVQRDYTEFKCVLNLEDLEGKPFERYESVEQPIDKSLALALVGTGWIVGKCSLKKKRTVRMSNCSSLEIIREIKKTYRCDLVFNTLSKTIDVYEHLGEDKGTYFIDSLNLKELSIQGNSYQYYTRIIPIGKDDLRITDINNGKEYVENYQYSSKVKTVYWKDDRYTIVENLKEDAEAKLDEISKPYRAYAADIINLAKISDDYKDILDYKLGDTINLISKDNKFRDKQRIVKIVEHPDEHELDTIELANTILSFEERQTEFQEAADTVDNITTDNGTIDGSTIDSIKTNQISDFEVNVVKITDLTAVNAKIHNLESHNVTITGKLTAVEGKIGTLTTNVASIEKLTVTHSAQINDLQAGKASIGQLEATNATIKVLEANVGKIDTLVSGNLSSENIQTGGITGNSLNMKTIFVDDANILSVNASKIHAGEINTNKVKITSDDGGIEIVGATQQFKDKNNKVRIQMGKDTQGNFNFIIRGEDGTTTLIDHTGVKEKAIADDLIKSNMISSNAVGEKQIDYSSFSEGFNKETNTHTLNSTKIKLNNQNQTLDVAFNSLKTQSDNNKSLTESHSTTIGVMQGQISTAINNTQIVKDGQTILLKDDYNRTVETVDSLKSTIGSHTTQLNQATGKINNVETKVNTVERDLNSITARVSSTEINITNVTNLANAANNKIDNLKIGGRNLLKGTDKYLETVPGRFTDICIATSPNSLAGKTVTISVDIVAQGLTPGEKDRLGAELAIGFEDGTTQYIGCWLSSSVGDYNGRFSRTYNIPNKPIKEIYYCGIYIQCNAKKVKLGRLKLEFGNKATDWTPAPEEVEEQITSTTNKVAIIETTLNSITSRVSSVETTNSNLNGQITNLSTRMTEAEVKILPKSIINTVSSQFYKKDETNSIFASKTELKQTSDGFNMYLQQTGGTNEILNSKCLNSTDFMYIGGHTGSPIVKLFKGKPNIQFTVKNYGSAGGFQTASIPVTEGEKHTLAFEYVFERGMESYVEIHYYTKEHTGFGAWPDVKKEIPYSKQLGNRGKLNYTTTVPPRAKWMKFYIYTTYDGVDSAHYPYAHAYIDNLRCFRGEVAGNWCPAAEEMYTANIKFNRNGIEQTYNNQYLSRWGADALEFLTPSGVRKLAIDRSQFCTYNFNDGNFLSFFGATQNASHSMIFGNALSSSRHCAFFDISHQPEAIDDSKPITNLNSYFRINFFDYDDQVKGTHIYKYPMYIHQNLYIDNNAKVTQDLEVWGDIAAKRNLDAKRITCRSGIDMMKMSVENLYATKYGFGSGCIVKGDGYRLELGGTSKGDTGGTKIGVADEYGNISNTIWISAFNFIWNKADWNFGGHNIYDAHVYGAYTLTGSPGGTVGCDAISTEAMLLQEDFSEYDDKNNAVVVNINEAVKSVYAINKKLESENAQLKQENENLNKELETTKNALDTILMNAV